MIDPTFADFPGYGLDAADKEHCYHGISKEVYEKYKEKLEKKEKKQIEQNFEEIKEDQDKEEKLKKHNEILKRIQYRNFLVFQQEIIDMITKYDPKATRGRKIIVDEESYRNIRRRERQKVMEVRKQIAQDGEDKK